MTERTCAACGSSFTPRSANARFCPPPPGKRKSLCAKRFENAASRGADPYTGPAPAPYDCAQCGAHCVPGENVAAHAKRFCGGRCKNEWHRAHSTAPSYRGVTRAERRRRAAQRKLAKAAAGVGPTGVRIAGPCQNPKCRAPFVGVHIDSRYCSRRCHRAVLRWRENQLPATRARRVKESVERSRRMGWRDQIHWTVVAERDGLDCGICGEPVDIDAALNSDPSPTTDHIVPLALGGEHTLDNVQLAHFICNARKRDLVAADEIESALLLAH